MKFYPRYKQLLPLGIFLLFALLAAWGRFVGTYEGNVLHRIELNVRHYVGFALLVIAIASFFLLRKYYRYVVLFMLALGIFNVAWFSGSNFFISIGGSQAQLTLQPLSMLVAFCFFLVNFKTIDAWLKQYRQTEQYEAAFSQKEKMLFREKYATFSNEELNTVRSNVKYMPEARRAAEELLSERLEAKAK
jgi:hypothetical protein